MATHGGLLGWANTVRLTMATDPGRQLFQEQVQTHGFLFLDDYLDNILSGAKQDPLIELVKTPGRKKAIARKPTLNSKLANVIALSLEDDDSKENVAPINNFHKALLNVKNITPPPIALPTSSHPTSGNSVHEFVPRVDALQQPDSHSTITQNSTTTTVPLSRPSSTETEQQETQVQVDNIAVPAHQEQNELSVIAEDDESAERSRASIQLGRGDTSSRDLLPVSGHQQMPEILPNEQPTPNIPTSDSDLPDEALHVRTTSSSSANSFHSILIDSPAQERPSESSHEVPASPPAFIPTSVPPQHQYASYNHTAPLPQTQPLHQQLPIHDDAMTAPLPVSSEHFHTTSTYDMEVPIRDPDEATTINHGAPYKANVSLFPTLPEPMPLRKSMKAHRDPSTGAVMVGGATPGAPVGGKRTSWLMKAREAKALEGIGRKHTASANGTRASAHASGSSLQDTLKRKSGDLVSLPGTMGLEDEERKYKVAKNLESDIAPVKSKTPELTKSKEKEDGLIPDYNTSRPLASISSSHIHQPPPSQDGVLDRLRKTVEDLGARVGKSMGKSVGGTVAGDLAEARAAAEARVAERNQKEEDEMTLAMEKPSAFHAKQVATSSTEPSPAVVFDAKIDSEFASSGVQEQRLSISDLFPSEGKVKGKHKAPQKVFQFPSSSVQPFAEIIKETNASRESTSTTPPHSPPHTQSSTFNPSTGPVFNKPPPVFAPPVAPTSSKPPGASAKDYSFNLPPATTFSMPASMSIGMSPRLPSPTSLKPIAPTLSAQSTLESVKSDKLFDDHEDAPAWMPSTQETEYSTAYGSQSQPSQDHRMTVVDEDDSWPIDDKLAAGVQWTFGKEESMTWSTLPSQSQRADTGPMSKDQIHISPIRGEDDSRQVVPGTFETDIEQESDDLDEMDACDSDLEDIVRGAGKSTVSLVEPKTNRSASAMSMASSASSQSQVGFLGQASKFLSSALGTSKKGKPEVKKVLQMAAVAAKKQQEEADKKAARLKDMENRRLLAQQRKAEEEKIRALEQERKLKEEGERRKREREDITDKRPLKAVAGSKKPEEDTTKKRKVEAEKKPEIKKPTQTLSTKPSIIKSSFKQSSALASSTGYNSSLQTTATSTSNTKAGDASKSLMKAPTSSLKGKGKAPAAKSPVEEDDISQPSQVLQTQMAARANAQIQAAKQAAEPLVTSESIELPDINSEYSDSEDEGRSNKFDAPDWAQSPELRQALQMQSTINPDDIFGAVRPLRMEEMFKARTSRFRARTSSANWTGADRLTLEEEREYARRMGFR